MRTMLGLPQKFEVQEDALDCSPDNIAVFTHTVEKPGWPPCSRISYPAADASDDEFWTDLWDRCFIVLSSVMVRRDGLLRVGGFNTDLRWAEDWELWFRLIKAGRFVQVPMPLCYRRMHPKQLSQNLHQMVLQVRKVRNLVMTEHGERISAAGISPRQQQSLAKEEYRSGILWLYFQRQLALSRRLLWDYLRENPWDSKVLKYALLSLLPKSLFSLYVDK
jgi:GT2 family glycosyltransferase